VDKLKKIFQEDDKPSFEGSQFKEEYESEKKLVAEENEIKAEMRKEEIKKFNKAILLVREAQGFIDHRLQMTFAENETENTVLLMVHDSMKSLNALINYRVHEIHDDKERCIGIFDEVIAWNISCLDFNLELLKREIRKAQHNPSSKARHCPAPCFVK